MFPPLFNPALLNETDLSPFVKVIPLPSILDALSPSFNSIDLRSFNSLANLTVTPVVPVNTPIFLSDNSPSAPPLIPKLIPLLLVSATFVVLLSPVPLSNLSPDNEMLLSPIFVSTSASFFLVASLNETVTF